MICLYGVGAARSLRDIKRKTGQVRQVRGHGKRESGLQVLGSLLGRGGAVSGAGPVGCLLTTDKLRFFHW